MVCPACRGEKSLTKHTPQEAFVTDERGELRLQAPLTFASVPAIFPMGVNYIRAAGAALKMDLQCVSAIDSAGLAMLIDWLGLARSHNCQLSYSNPSPALLSLAQLSDLHDLVVA